MRAIAQAKFPEPIMEILLTFDSVGLVELCIAVRLGLTQFDGLMNFKFRCHWFELGVAQQRLCTEFLTVLTVLRLAQNRKGTDC